jgi:hypothetical protein
MNAITKKTQEREELEALLPWHAAGTLGRKDAQRVDQALKSDIELQRRFALVREEFGETIHLNETLGAPSARAMNKLMAGIEKESGPAKQVTPRFSFGTWLSEKFGGFSARTLAYAGTAAAVIIVAQAGLIGSMYRTDGGAEMSYGDTSRGLDTPAPNSKLQSKETDLAVGTFMFIGFVPSATNGDVTSFLENNKLVLVDGPRAGKLYKVRVSANAMSKDQVDALANRLKENRGVVSVVLPDTTAR